MVAEYTDMKPEEVVAEGEGMGTKNGHVAVVELSGSGLGFELGSG